MITMKSVLVALTLLCWVKQNNGVTDEEFRTPRQLLEEQCSLELSVMVLKMRDQIQSNAKQGVMISELRAENRRQAAQIERLDNLVSRISEKCGFEDELAENGTVEERVTLLEIQMDEVQGDVSQNEGDISLLFTHQIIQDERLVDLEDDTSNLEQSVENLQVSALELEQRLNTLEENTNSLVAQLELRVTTLEETDTNHEARIMALEDVTLIEPIAFYAVLTSYDTLPEGSTVEFNDIVLNEGNGYNNATGVFTVPSGGDGLYYFSIYLVVDTYTHARFHIMVNGEVLCTAVGDHSVGDDVSYPQATCSAVIHVTEADEVEITVALSPTDTPLRIQTDYIYNGFSGFRI